MKIRVLSDLHLEFQDWVPPAVEADVVVLAGDINLGADAVSWARRRFGGLPVIYIPGNHEFYGRDLSATLELLRTEGRREGVTVLEGSGVVIAGVRFLGATLWTDFALMKECASCGHVDSDEPMEAHARNHAASGMNDFHVIRYKGRRFTPRDSQEIHFEQRRFLETKLAQEFDGPTVVVTHHLPSVRSVARRFSKSILNAAFASDLTALFGPKVPLWIHGHTHDSCDYIEQGTRVVCNPRGYLPADPNPGFKPDLVVEVP